MPDLAIGATTMDALGARLVRVRGHHPLVLDNPRVMWLVQGGAVAVFTSRVHQGLPVGPRRFLFNAVEGTPLFPVSDGRAGITQRLIALSLEDATLIEAPLRRADELLTEAGESLQQAIENWVSKLSAFAADGMASTITDRFPREGKFGLPDGMLVRVKREAVAWVQVESGELHALGMPELRIGKLPFMLPVGDQLWLEAVGETRVRVRTAAPSDDGLELVRGLALFNSLLQQRLKLLEQEEQTQEQLRLLEADEREQRLFTTSMEQMAAVLNPRPVVPQRETPLLTAASLVGQVLGIEMRGPARSEDMRRVKDPVEAIARASRIRHRTVILGERWWESDNGPLLAYLEEGHRPVALLRHQMRGYELADPETGEVRPVDEAVDAALEPKAVMFYRPLPAETRTAWQIPRWALRGRFWDLGFIAALSLTITLVGMLVPQATALIMDNAIPDANRGMLLELGLALVAAAFGSGLFAFAQGILSIRVGITSDAVSQAGVWDRLLTLRMPVFRKFTSGDLLDRAMAISAVNRELNGQTMRSLLTSVTSLLNLALLYYYNSQLAMIALGLGVAVAVVTIGAGLFIRRYYRELMELQGRFFGLVVEMVNAVSKIRVAGAQRRAFSLWASRYTEQLTLLLRAQRLEDYIIVFNQAVPLISSILLFWMGVDLLTKGATGQDGDPLTVGVFLAFNTAMGTFLGGATFLSATVLEFLDTLAKANRMKPLLAAATETDAALVNPGVLQGGVAFASVDFRYSAEGTKVLDDLSFKVNPGEFVAFVGPSGSGKSTIFRLLLGFEQAESGKILYDGQDLGGLDATAVRRQLGVVLQSARISSGSIFENIGVGASINLDEAWEAAEDAGFGDDIREMPMGMHTVVSEGGTNLSGGQRQRLLIARALVTQPRILLFDEATSALDNRTQATVSASLDRRKVTRLVIAHRLSTIRNADRIYVLDRGAIAEVGTFDELVKGGGVFASMMARQVA